MEYEEIRLIKQSEKSTVHLVKPKGEEQVLVRKILKGKRPIYSTLQNCWHPYLPRLEEVILSDDVTTVIEEYVEGEALGSAELSEKQIVCAAKELCDVLEFLHEKEIIHRDIKPSNLILAKDGHIRLIDFDAARMPKDDLEQDTRLLGTRGYAPPEQYGFSQTDARADIYAFGVTLKQLLGERAAKPRFKRIIQKCTNLNPDKRYQSARQVKRALSYRKSCAVYSCAAIILAAVLLWIVLPEYLTKPEITESPEQKDTGAEPVELTVLDAPVNPHWNGVTGIGVWGNVPESGTGGEVGYYYRLYRMDTETPPDPQTDEYIIVSGMRGNGGIDTAAGTYSVNMVYDLQENGFYYFEVCAAGDGIQYADSAYVMSDAFEYTGEDAEELPVPEGLQWKMYEGETERVFYAIWSNLDDYADTDSFNVTVYDKNGDYVMNNIWTKAQILERGYGGIRIRQEFLTDVDGAYRFTVQALTSRPNEYRSSPMPDPIPEEYYSPWYYH